MKWLNKPILLLLKFYKKGISPFLGNRCRFYPSCSSYALEAFERFWFGKALAKSIWRILRCNPFNAGGYDPVLTPKQGDKNNEIKKIIYHRY